MDSLGGLEGAELHLVARRDVPRREAHERRPVARDRARREAIEQDASVVRLDDEAPAVVHGGGEAIAHVVGHGRDRRGALLVATTQRRRCEQREKREAETT
jgi:hypothetical protein